MRTVDKTINEYQSAVAGWSGWARRLEALVMRHPVPCHCWDGNRNATEGHTGLCAEWRTVAQAIRTKPALSYGPGSDDE